MPNSVPDSMKILIVGGGIGGLSLAGFLKSKAIEFTIVEKTKEWKTVGYVLGLYPNGVKILEALGVARKVKKEAAKLRGYRITNSSGKMIWEIGFKDWERKYGPLLLLERDRLHEILRSNVKKSDIRLGIKIKSLKNIKGGAEVVFSDNKKEVFDLVVGADGINSQIRSFVDPGAEKLSSGFSFWVMWLGRKFKFPDRIIYSVGNGKVFSVFPVKSKTHIGVAFSLPLDYKPTSNTAEFLRRSFGDMGGLVPAVLKNLPKEIYNHQIEDLKIKNWFKGRVVLLGDAVHPISPILGMGASMAMEDAYVLSEELSRNKNIDAAIKEYVKRRELRVGFLQKKSRETHRLLAVKKPFVWLRDFILKFGYSRSYYKSLDKFLGEKA